jgi:hypothetical protein
VGAEHPAAWQPVAVGYTKGAPMSETDHIWEALILRYGSDLLAATVTLLLKDGDKAVRFITINIPQKQEEQENE